MTQPELCFAPALPANFGRLERAFLEFDRANPLVWERFCSHCDDLIAAGFRYYSCDGILHAVRFACDLSVQSTGDTDADGNRLKINNSYSAFYARKWLALHPERPNFFRCRKQHAA